MNQKPENPFGVCTKKEIEIITIFRKLPPEKTDAFYVLLRNYARQEGIVNDEPWETPEYETVDYNGISYEGSAPFGRRKDEQ